MRALLFAFADTHALTGAAIANSSDYYTNVIGHHVHRPMHSIHVPRGVSARCRDETHSLSEHHLRACSHHGGVAVWI
jgi:hypothetical protein